MNKKMNKANNVQAENNDSALMVLSAQELGLEPAANVEVSFAIWVRALLQNWRQGTVGCKTRGEVSFSNKKPWKQKGTGRARAGSARSPLWRSGGVLFGPQPRVRTLKVNKQTKAQVLNACFAEYANAGNFYSLQWELQQDKPSTVMANTLLKNVGLSDKKVVLFLQRSDFVYWASLNNLPYVHVMSFDDVNAYDLALGNCVVVLKKDLDLFKNMVAQ